MLSKVIRILLIAGMLIGLLFVWSKSTQWRNAARDEAARPSAKLVASSQAVIAALEITDLKGKATQLPGTGRYRLINYWATWCGPCLMELPLLNEFSQSQRSQDVMVIGIALDEATLVSEYLQKNPLKYPQLLEKSSKNDSSNQLGNQRGIIPFSVLIAPDGRLLKIKQGQFTDLDDLEAFTTPPKA